MIGINGVCSNCNYKAITWHESIDDPRCRKCDGLIKIISSYKTEKAQSHDNTKEVEE